MQRSPCAHGGSPQSPRSRMNLKTKKFKICANVCLTGPTKRKGPIHPVGNGSLIKDFPNDASQLLDPPKRKGPLRSIPLWNRMSFYIDTCLSKSVCLCAWT